MPLSKLTSNSISTAETFQSLSTGGVERMRIGSDGNIGIGKTSGAQRLSISGANTSTGIVLINGVTSNNAGFIGNKSTWLGTGADDSFVMSSYGDRSLILATNATERMQIDGSGRATLPYQPSFLATGAGFGAQYFTNRSIGNYVNGIGGHNVGGHFSTGSSSGTLRFTAPVAGYYLFSAGSLWYGSANTTPSSVRIRVNGSTAAIHYRDSATYNQNENLSVIVYMAANDYADAYVDSTASLFFDNGATAGVYGNSNYNFFSGRLLG